MCVRAGGRLGMRPFDVQLAAGVVMHQGGLAELATGEGKTLIATLPAFLNALDGKGVHVTTVNDYLARRDAEWMRADLQGPGPDASASCSSRWANRTGKRATTATSPTAPPSEFGFDFLRDRLKVAGRKGQEAPFWAPWSPERAASARRPKTPTSSAPTTSPWWTRPTTSSSTRPARRSSSHGPTRLATEEEQIVYHWADDLATARWP